MPKVTHNPTKNTPSGKYLYFANTIGGDGFDQNEMVIYPAEALRGIEPADGGTTLNLWFDPMEVTTIVAADDVDLVQLTVTALKHKDVSTAIINAITSPSVTGLVTIADENTANPSTGTTGLYIHSDITAVAAITKAV